jgi:hypothetical protein
MGLCPRRLARETRQPASEGWTDNPDRRAVVRIAAAIHARPEDAAGLTVAAQFGGLQSISVVQAIYVRLSRDFYLGLQQLFNKFVVLKKNENC